MTQNELIKRIRQLKELMLMADEINRDMEAIKDLLKTEMENRGTNEMTVDVFKVRWQTVTTNRVDTTALKKELPEIAKRFTKTTESRRFSIS